MQRAEPESKHHESQALRDRIHSKLTRAAAGDRFAEVEKVLPESDVNWRGIFGNTALHWAIANTNIKMALFLLERAKNRIDFDVRDDRGKTSLHLAIGKGWYHFTDNAKQGTNSPPQAPVIQELVDLTPLNAQDALGNTPLHIAMIRRDINCVELLLKKGASLTVLNKNGQTPLDLLSASYNEATQFIKGYVHVFTLSKEIWAANGKTIRELLGQFSPSNFHESEVEEKASPSLALIKCNPIFDLDASLELREELNAPAEVIFEQAIFYLEDLKDSQREFDLSSMRVSQSCQRFREELIKLKEESKQLSSEAAKSLAKESLVLSRKVANFSVTQDDITTFHLSTQEHRKTSLLGKVIGAVIGAAIGVFVGVMAGMCAGPAAALTGLYSGVKGAVLGASLGGAFGAGLGFWGAKKILERTHALTRLEEAATAEVRRLDRIRI